MGRRLGQHFLRDHSVLERIAAAACPAAEPLVIEIGPGQGALTAYLLKRTDRLIAIELDEGLTSRLQTQFPAVEIVHQDILAADLRAWGECAIAGNLPYYISSPIIDRVLSLGTLCRRAVLMVQREVAERLNAKPGTSDYGYLSVATQARAKVEVLFKVPAGAFQPPPKVESAVVRLTPYPQSVDAAFLEFAGECFRQKRKTLRNNLVAHYPGIAGHPAAGLRAEQLSISELQDLRNALVS